MALVSPGVEVTVIDESQYAPTAAATVPLVVVATASNKTTPQGQLAEGTLAANAEDLYLLTSQRDVLNFFGTPQFYTNTNQQPLHGYELNEYGLQTVYSLLGTTSRCYVLRADVDLGQLVGLSGRPLADPDDMTYWLDTVPTRWGIFTWDAINQVFISRIPLILTNTADLDEFSAPKNSVGAIGDFAVVANGSVFPIYQKNRDNVWKLVGSEDWMKGAPTIQSAYISPIVSAGQSLEINQTIVTAPDSTVTGLASAINSASITGVTAAVIAGRLELYATDLATVDGSTIDSGIEIANDAGTLLEQLGISAGTYYRPVVVHEKHTGVPQWKSFDTTPRPTNSVWVKTTSPNFGASFAVKRYNELTGAWQLLSAPLYANDESANKAYDPTRGGRGIPVGSVYVQYDVNETDTLTFKVFDRVKSGPTVVTGTELSPTFVPGESFGIRVSVAGYDILSDEFLVTMTGSTADDFVFDLYSLGLEGSVLEAVVNTDGSISISHPQGGIIIMRNISGTPLDDAGIDFSNDFCREGTIANSVLVSNWVETEIEANEVEPGQTPSTGTKWYWEELEADIMVHDGFRWRGYRTLSNDARGFDLTATDPLGPIFSATEPTEQSDESALEYGDLWIDTSDLENFPKMYRWEIVFGEDKWVEIDLKDQTSENGILFADARFMGDETSDVALDDITSIEDLLTNDYVDIDAPDRLLYPRGMLLWNTRRSGYNVKEFRRNHFNGEDFPGEILPTERNAWVSISGFRENGHAYFGRKAQRSVVANAMRAAVDGSTEIREEQREFNLIAAPGYPELIPTMVTLNNDRKMTAFVVGDSPFRLPSEGTQLTDWLLNNELEGVDSEDALITRDPYVGVWYPSLMGADLTGEEVAMPPSYGVLRMMIRSDQVSFPWFAPAGVRRGVIDNATRLGYLTETNEFVTISVRQGVRDILYENAVNPIMYTAQTGIVAFGQKTRQSFASAMDRINVARLVAYMRLQLDKIVRPFLFEPNDKITRDEVKGVVDSFCNDLVAKRGLYDYLVICDESNNTPARIDRNELYIDVYIEPVKAIEFIYIPIRIKNTGEIEAGI